MRYTQQREDALYASWALDTNDDMHSAIIDVLNNSFRSFGEGIVAQMEEKAGREISEPLLYLKERCLENGIDLSEIGSLNTLKSWFAGGPRPKKAERSRMSMFALAFALKLSVKETADLFHKVYLDRAFDYREVYDVVCYYCLANNRTWDHAKQLMKFVPSDGACADQTVYTNVLRCSLDSIKADEELLRFLGQHAHNLSQKNVTAKAKLETLIDKAIAVAAEEEKNAEQQDLFRGSDRSSRSFAYEVITGISPSGDKGTISVFKNAALPKEIKSRFPEAASFSKADPTYEEVRKMIILLYSYIFWFNVQMKKVVVDLEDYTAELNAVLAECGYSELYVGNPYDWLFMYCTLEERPLDVFRGILAEVVDAG